MTRCVLRALVVAAILIGLGVVYLPAVGWSNDESAARERAAGFLRAAAGDSQDRGWSMLTASRVEVYADRDAYLGLAAGSDWLAFRWEIIDARCDDGVCTVWLNVASREAIPELLARGPLISREDHVPEGANAAMVVLQRGWFGGIGVNPQWG